MNDFDKELDKFLKDLEGTPQDAPVETPKSEALTKADALVKEYVDMLREKGTPLVIADGEGEPHVNVVVVVRLIEDMHKIFTVFDAIGAPEIAERHRGFDALRTALLSLFEAGVQDALDHGEIIF